MASTCSTPAASSTFQAMGGRKIFIGSSRQSYNHYVSSAARGQRRESAKGSDWLAPKASLRCGLRSRGLRARRPPVPRRTDRHPELSAGRGGRIAQGARGRSRRVAPPACHATRSRRDPKLGRSPSSIGPSAALARVLRRPAAAQQTPSPCPARSSRSRRRPSCARACG